MLHAISLCPPVRPPVRHKPVLYRNDWTDQGWFLAWRLRFTYPTLCYKETRVPKINYFPLELCTNFGLIRKFLYGKSIVLYEQLLCAFAPNLTNAANEMNIN